MSHGEETFMMLRAAHAKKKIDIIYSGTVDIETKTLMTSSWKKRYMELYSVRSPSSEMEIRLRLFKDQSEALSAKDSKKDWSIKGGIFRETELKKKPLCIKVSYGQNWKQSSYFCAEDEASFFQWKDYLLNSGVAQEPKEISMNNPLGRIQVMDVRNWTEEDVQSWLSCIRLEDDESKEIIKADSLYKSIFKSSKINGHKLIELQRAKLQSLGIDNPHHIRQILTGILVLKQDRVFNLSKHRVFEKFEKMKKGQHSYLGDLEDLEFLVESLSNVSLLKQVYLNTKSLSEEELKKYYSYEKEDGDIEMMDGGLQSVASSLQEQIRGEQLRFTVKLVVTEITRNASTKNLRKILSPIMALLPNMSSQFGLFHTALIVGPWYLDWNDSSFCIPRKMASSMALLSADLPPLVIPADKLDDVIDRLSAVIVNWNVNYVYHNRLRVGEESVGKQKMGNCQHFVDALLRCLNIAPQFKGALSSFLNDMKEKGSCEMIFKPDRAFRMKYKLDHLAYKFNSHEELDNFVNELIATSAQFKLDNEGEYALLKSFDRAFWLRHLKNLHDTKFKPLVKRVEKRELEEVCHCPFKDPRDTGSFAGQRSRP